MMEKSHMIEKRLYDATLKGDVETLEALMREDELVLARLSITSCFNQTPLHLASVLGHYDYAKSLLRYKPNFATWLDSQDRSPLHLASANGYIKIVNLLLQEDPSVCLVRDEDGRTPLHLAVMNGQYESINKLVEAKPEVTCYTLDPHTSKFFRIFNTISFIASLSIIFLFVTGISAKRELFIRVLRAAMWIIVSSMAVAYLVAVTSFIPGPNRNHSSTFVTVLVAAMTWDGLIFVSLLFLTNYLVDAALKKFKKYRKRISRNRGEGILTESTRSIV